MRIERFLASQRDLSLTYAEVGASAKGSPPRFDLDHNRIQIGKGASAYQAACEAMRQWAMFPKSWTAVQPGNIPLDVDNTVAILFRVFGCWWTSAARIVYVVNEFEPFPRFGFAYGTLPGHVEIGEERFTVEWLPDDTVWYDIRAFSRPRHWLVRLGYPIARFMQRRFVRDSQEAMKAFVAGHLSK